MIKDFTLPVLGHLAYSIVGCNGKFYEVSTINLPLTRLENYSAQWRDDWWQPPYPNETMVWGCEESGRRFGDILHCQGYRKPKSAIREHRRFCRKIEAKGTLALNGREFQTASRDKDRMPVGLINDMARRLKGIDLL